MTQICILGYIYVHFQELLRGYELHNESLKPFLEIPPTTLILLHSRVFVPQICALA